MNEQESRGGYFGGGFLPGGVLQSYWCPACSCSDGRGTNFLLSSSLVGVMERCGTVSSGVRLGTETGGNLLRISIFAAAEGERLVFPGSARTSGGCPELFRLEDTGQLKS